MPSNSMRTQKTATDAKSAENKLGLNLVGVVVFAIVTLLGCGLAKWRQADNDPDTANLTGTAREMVEAITAFMRFPDWWVTNGLASYGEFVTNHWAVSLQVMGAVLLLIVLIRKVPAIKW